MKRLISIAAAVLTLVLAASSAASASAAARRSGTEVIAASTTDVAIIVANVSVLPAKASGVVNTEGTVALAGPATGTSTLHFRTGQLTIRHTQTSGGGQPSLNPKTCVISLSEGGVYTVLGGTGKFSGATGSGKYQIHVILTVQRLNNGTCDTSRSARPTSGSASFLAYGPLSVR